MVSLVKEGFNQGAKKSKFTEMKGCGTTFMGLWGCADQCKEGVIAF